MITTQHTPVIYTDYGTDHIELLMTLNTIYEDDYYFAIHSLLRQNRSLDQFL
jgi:hypothetical protein